MSYCKTPVSVEVLERQCTQCATMHMLQETEFSLTHFSRYISESKSEHRNIPSLFSLRHLYAFVLYLVYFMLFIKLKIKN